jgi:hydroxyacylglutathione hydrolase
VDGEEVDLGGLTLRALATPGHAPEHVSYLLLDGGHPQALFSGGRSWWGPWPAPTWPARS